MPNYRFVVCFTHSDPRSTAYMADAHALGFNDLKRLECQDLYFVEGQLSQEDCKQLTLKLLTDPVTQSADWEEVPAHRSSPQPAIVIEVALRPGVTDPVAAEIVRAAHELGFKGVLRAATGYRYLVEGLDDKRAEQIAQRLLVNNVIQHWKIGEIEPSFPIEAASSGEVELFSIRSLDDEKLLDLSKERRAALDLAEMKAIQAYCQQEHRDLTDVEFEAIAQTWSEHCGHKTFKAKVTLDSGATIDSILKTYLKSATDEINASWVISAFVDNAGIIDLDGENEVSFKVETHNHPSAIEPFGGANTGVGGVIRDVLGVSHKPIANTDILCFGPQDATFEELPAGVLHPRRIQSGVVAGVQDYGNKIGIPTVNGAILYDPGFTANPLVFCGCVGVSPKGLHAHAPQKGDRCIVLGGRTGRDGLRGATFSSMTMDAQTGEVAGASVQIGDPITEKGLIDVIVRARDLHLYTAITDCGAGGLSSAAGEMASTIGADIDISHVQLKYPGLAPWEVWLSEAQERMVLAVPAKNIPALQELCNTFDTELTDLGEFTGSRRLVVRYGGKVVLNLDNEFLHDGIPQRQLEAVINKKKNVNRADINQDLPVIDNASTLLKLLSHPNIASKSHVIRIYDHEIQGGTVVKPLTGVQDDAPSDACVLKPIGTRGSTGIVLSNGINPEYGKRDAYHMAFAVMDEAIRNAVAVGADPARIAVLDNFCWGDPLRPETLGSLLEAARGCHDAALAYKTPFISGKDSLNNEYLGTDGQRHAIPPTLLISAMGIIEDVGRAVTMDLKAAGNVLYLVGDFNPTLGGSHLALITSGIDEPIPAISPNAPLVYNALHNAIIQGIVLSAHDLSEGGLAVAAAEMCIGGRLGLELTLASASPTRALFGETNGCLLVEIEPENVSSFEEQFAKLPFLRVAKIISEPVMALSVNNSVLISVPVDGLAAAFNKYA